MKLEWDDKKRSETLAKRGLDFADVASADWGSALTVEDTRTDYAEVRFVTMAPINNRLCVFAGCWRGDVLRSSASAKRMRGKGAAMKKPYTNRDGEVRELDQGFFATAKRGRPAMPVEAKKRRVNVMLDPDVAERLKALPNASAYVNELLRSKFAA